MPKTIKFYRRSQYGTDMEFVHPENQGDAQILRQLTGKLTINGVIRELVRDLTAGQISFVETIAPPSPR